MKLSLFLLAALMSLSTWAGNISVECGELLKVKETKKINILYGDVPAIKIKLKHAITILGDSTPMLGEESRIKRVKVGFLDSDNFQTILSRFNEALELKNKKGVIVYACLGKVTGFDHWHKVGEVSTISSLHAFELLQKKYSTKPIVIKF